MGGTRYLIWFFICSCASHMPPSMNGRIHKQMTYTATGSALAQLAIKNKFVCAAQCAHHHPSCNTAIYDASFVPQCLLYSESVIQANLIGSLNAMVYDFQQYKSRVTTSTTATSMTVTSTTATSSTATSMTETNTAASTGMTTTSGTTTSSTTSTGMTETSTAASNGMTTTSGTATSSTTSTGMTTTSRTTTSTATSTGMTTTRTTTSTGMTTTSRTTTRTTTISTRRTSTTTSATTTPATVPLSLFGVQRNLNPSSLPSGWSLCYRVTYATPTSSSRISSILSTCNKNKLLLGCRAVGSTTLTVAAMGARSDVLYDCGSASSCVRTANGVGWYFSSSYSWGFAKGGDAVERSSCDLTSTNGNYRLCWHTETDGGYRCGATTDLNSDTDWEKVIYHAN